MYFRGRKLIGKEVKIPNGYQGLVVEEVVEERKTGKNSGHQGRENEGESGDEDENLRSLQEISSFKEITLWGHDATVPEDDPFVKGIGEWISFAEAVSFRDTKCSHLAESSYRYIIQAKHTENDS